MLVVLDLLELEKVEGDLVVDEAEVGGVLRVERGNGRFGLEARTPFAIELFLRGEALWADVVELSVEIDGFAGRGIGVLVIAGL